MQHLRTVALSAFLLWSGIVTTSTAHAVSVHGHVLRVEDGLPVAGATVAIEQPTFMGSMFPLATLTAAADGSFAWDGACSGFGPWLCRVHASATGYADAGATIENNVDDFGVELALHRPVSISGHVRIDGTPAAAPLSVTLTCLQSDGIDCATPISRTVDAQGNYSIDTLPGGTYRICAGRVLYGSVSQCYDHLDHGALANEEPSSVLAINDGEIRSNVDFDMRAGGSISGTLRENYSGRPLPNAGFQFELFDAQGAPFGFVPGTTDATGGYTLVGLPDGTFYASMYVSGPFSDGRQLYPGIVCDSGECSAPLTGQPLAVVNSAGITGIDFTFTPFAVVSGRVTDASNGEPLAGIAVAALDCWTFSNCLIVETAQTNAAGNYTMFISDSPNERFVITANRAPYVDQVYPDSPCIAQAPCAFFGTPFDFVQGQHASNIDFSLWRGASMGGTVSSAFSATPLAGSIVTIYDSNREPIAFAIADQAGHYSGPAWFAGTYYAFASSSDACSVYLDRPCLFEDETYVVNPTPIELEFQQIRTDIDFRLADGDTIFRNGFR